MGNTASRAICCFKPFSNGKNAVNLEVLEPLDEGLGHSFCYVRPVIADSPAITPSTSDRYTACSSTVDTETQWGSFRQEVMAEDFASLQKLYGIVPETTFKTISGASVSANASSAKTGANLSLLFTGECQQPAASFESTASFAAIPLQPAPRGSGPLNSFMSGPLERGFPSGHLERGVGFMSGPLDKGVFSSGPIDGTDRNNFSAPPSHNHGRKSIKRFVRSMSRPMKTVFCRAIAKHLFRLIKQSVYHLKDANLKHKSLTNCEEAGASEPDGSNMKNLQWAHGKAGEDRVHVVLSEELGWLFVGIYDGFSGPDAPDFLMSNLYKTVDKEMEGLLWDYETQPQASSSSAALPSSKSFCAFSDVSVGQNITPHDIATEMQFSDSQLCDDLSEVKTSAEVYNFHLQKYVCEGKPVFQDRGMGTESMQDDEKVDSRSLDFQPMACEIKHDHDMAEILNAKNTDLNLNPEEHEPNNQLVSSSTNISIRSTGCIEKPAGLREIDLDLNEKHWDPKQQSATISDIKQKKLKRLLVRSKLKKMLGRRKSILKKLFLWKNNWRRNHIYQNKSETNHPAAVWKSKTGPVDHDAVMKAMGRALKLTEEAYAAMVEKALDIHPELALMGSCVLVMLMKDEDVYVMNLGDSRAVLAQDRLIDRDGNAFDSQFQNQSREPLVRVELDRISEESPMCNPANHVCRDNKNHEISICESKLKAVQLSTDHSTSIEQEVMRIKAEHADDPQAVSNGRVKGQLKVTRAFGAEFLKQPRFNDVLLEIFRVDFVGNLPYLCREPSVVHHRLCSNDRFIVLSSDGLYEYFSNEEVISHVAWFMESIPDGDPAQYLIAELLFRAAKKNGMEFHELLDIPHGDRRRYHDDVSVMVISLEGRIWRSSG